MTTLERNIEEAVGAAEGAEWLRGYLRGLLDAGIPHEVLMQTLRVVYERLQGLGFEPGADLALDGLDLLTGWCGPGMGLTERTGPS